MGRAARSDCLRDGEIKLGGEGVDIRRVTDPSGKLPVPHYRDYFEGHRFLPFRLAPTGPGCWVMEMLLPALVFVDEVSRAISSPHVLARPRGGEARDLLVHGDVLWVLWADGVTRYDPRSREQIDLPATPVALASNRWAVFGLFPSGEIARLDDLDGGVAIAGHIPTPAMQFAAGSDLVFGLSWTDTTSQITTLTALDPQRRATRFHVQLHGAPYGLVADKDSLWVNVWRRQADGMSGHVIEIDSAGGCIRGELELGPTGRIDPVADGQHVRTRCASHEVDARDRPPQLERVDLRTGHVTGLAALDGWISWPFLGPTAIWGRLEPAAKKGDSTIVAVPLDGSAPRYYDVSGVDTSSYLPPPPPPIEAEPTEQEICKRLADALFGGWVFINPDTEERENPRPYIHGVTIETVERHGSFPNTEIVITFSADIHPGIRFARKQRIWDNDGAVSAVIRYMDVNLMEDVEACGHGLPPEPQADASGTVWF